MNIDTNPNIKKFTVGDEAYFHCNTSNDCGPVRVVHVGSIYYTVENQYHQTRKARRDGQFYCGNVLFESQADFENARRAKGLWADLRDAMSEIYEPRATPEQLLQAAALLGLTLKSQTKGVK